MAVTYYQVVSITSSHPVVSAGQPSSQIMLVTPKMAHDFLSRQTVNRRLDAGRVKSLAEAILRGEWKLTHQGIALDDSGALLDGQHRLRAIIEANSSVEMFVFGGFPTEVFPVLDTGKRRSAADTLLSTGAKYLPLLSSTIRHVILFKLMPNAPWGGARAHVPNDRILASYKEHKERYEEAVNVGRDISRYLFASQTAVATGFFVTTEVAPAVDVDDWLSGLRSGANLDPGDARLALREMPRETQKRGSRRRMGIRDQVSIYIKAWNAWVEPQQEAGLRLRRLRKGEKMPTLIEVPFERGRG